MVNMSHKLLWLTEQNSNNWLDFPYLILKNSLCLNVKFTGLKLTHTHTLNTYLHADRDQEVHSRVCCESVTSGMGP